MAENLTTCYLLENYNNYFNKRVKLDTNYLDYNNLNLQLNFNPNDGIRTEVVIGGPEAKNLTFEADYFVTVAGSGESEVTLSRWFVTEQVRLRNGQYRLSLKRDLLADYYGSIVNSPCYIEKATVNLDDPAIYNSEGIQYNQIKKSETLLKDETRIGWIVGYVDRSLAEDKTINLVADPDYDLGYELVEDYVGDNKFYQDINFNLRVFYRHQLEVSAEYNSIVKFSDSNFNNGVGVQRLQRTHWIAPKTYGVLIDDTSVAISTSLLTRINERGTAIRTALSSRALTNVDSILNWQNKRVYDVNQDKYYYVRITKTEQQVTGRDIVGTTAMGAALYQVANDVATDIGGTVQAAGNNAAWTLSYTEVTYTLSLEQYTPLTYTMTLTAARQHLDDAPYDMFAIPYPVNTTRRFYRGSYPVEVNKELSLKLAQAIAAELGGASGSSSIYDLQILPYCPIDGFTYNELGGWIDITALDQDKQINKLVNGSTEYNYLFWATKSTGTLNIYEELPLPLDSIEVKVENDTKFYRLNSPNYNGSFEFNNVRNGGTEYFNVDWTYRPYNPYIHVNPNFKNLYGKDFNDARGLICGGDFSAAIVDDKWANYQINNKNFQNIFDREIQSLEFNRKFQVVGQVANAVTGTVSGAVQGAMSGGGVAGAIVGGVASAAGGIADIAMDAAKYKEGMDLKVDLFNYNLGNVKALPNSLTKSSSITENSKIWPFLEEYDATEVEKQSLRDKITYNGMTIMRIGKIYDFLKEEETFIQGQMIRLENFAGDSHMANEIYLEIKKGAYFTLWQIFNPQ